MFETIFNFLLIFISFLICLGIIFIIVSFLFSIKQKTDEELTNMHETELELQKARDKKIAMLEKRDKEHARKEKEKTKLAKEAEVLIRHMEFKPSDLAPIVLKVVKSNNFSDCKATVELVESNEVGSVLDDCSERLRADYEKGIEDCINSRSPISFSHKNQKAVEQLNLIVEQAIKLGSKAIGKKIGHSAVSTVSSSSKGEIRKTKKWKD
tara:strand:+ start:381 stop:1010 length:630 start_codon:yes stop_codon:yes gene_type:complete